MPVSFCTADKNYRAEIDRTIRLVINNGLPRLAFW